MPSNRSSIERLALRMRYRALARELRRIVETFLPRRQKLGENRFLGIDFRGGG